ncbi:hypothetical protein DFR86_04010 [Acidianus sulfidivorans JP7]|uniref:Uncharacterized protein n=1 Tax=Acidianus sulfidivorans JP7 TaxID=619593 RepID=A0A2U9IL97_9CREN|nr:hypothetical protein [Acidianus sulfidivorans]AWR96802.1 hypothetical protein DFR86_04010 [Acidianus sulfidivorans JP7]
MSDISASGFTGVFTVRTFSELDLYAFAGRLAGLGYEVAQIKLSGNTGYIYIPINENGAFAKKNLGEIYYQPRTFTVVSEDLGNFQLATGEMIRAMKESGCGSIDYAELTISFERVIPNFKISYDSWDLRGFTLSRNELNSKNYEQISVSRINDALCRYLITIYNRGEYEELAKLISMLRNKMDTTVEFLLKTYSFLNRKE